MTNPATGQPITWANLMGLVPLVMLIAAIMGVWATLKSDAHASDLRITALESRMTAGEGRGQTRDARVTALEIGFGRFEERLDYIVDGVSRIEQRLSNEAP